LRIECKRSQGSLFFTQTLVNSPYLQTAAIVIFYIDTGATSTIISEIEARKNKIDYSLLTPSNESAKGIGDSVPFKLLKNCSILFSSETSVNLERLPEIGVFQRRDEKQSLTRMSLLGLDILIRFKIHFIQNGERMILEKD
jgi:hypothetical protein